MQSTYHGLDYNIIYLCILLKFSRVNNLLQTHRLSKERAKMAGEKQTPRANNTRADVILRLSQTRTSIEHFNFKKWQYIIRNTCKQMKRMLHLQGFLTKNTLNKLICKSFQNTSLTIHTLQTDQTLLDTVHKAAVAYRRHPTNLRAFVLLAIP